MSSSKSIRRWPPCRERTTEIHLCLHLPADQSMQDIANIIADLARTLNSHCCYRSDPRQGQGAYHLYPQNLPEARP